MGGPLEALGAGSNGPDRRVWDLQRPRQDRHALIIVMLTVPLERVLLGPRLHEKVVRLVVPLPLVSR